jgi:hypothetical protein
VSLLSVGREGSSIACTPRLIVQYIYATASSYHDGLFASCFAPFYASSVTCTNDVPHVSFRYRFMPSSMRQWIVLNITFTAVVVLAMKNIFK